MRAKGVGEGKGEVILTGTSRVHSGARQGYCLGQQMPVGAKYRVQAYCVLSENPPTELQDVFESTDLRQAQSSRTEEMCNEAQSTEHKATSACEHERVSVGRTGW